MEASKPYLNTLAQSSEDGQAFTGVNYTQIDGKQDSWIRVMYSLCIFMFVTLVLAAGSIIFLKIGNEVYEDKERYKILEKMGIQKKSLRKSVRNEICFTYYCPFILMMITSYFSVKALGNVMREDLFVVNIWSMGIILLIFTVICAISVYTAKKKLSLISQKVKRTILKKSEQFFLLCKKKSKNTKKVQKLYKYLKKVKVLANKVLKKAKNLMLKYR